MKKLFYYVLAITVAAIAAVSCNKGEEDHIVKEETSFCYTFTIADDITKATLDGQGVQWVSGDKVGMYIVESDGVTEVYTGYANVDVNNSPKAIKLYSKKAIPAGAIAYTYFPQHSNGNKTATVIRFDAEQQGGGKSVMPMVGLPFTVKTEVPLTGSGNNAKAETNGVIHFLNLGAIIDFKVFGENFNTETIQSIKFKATGKKVNNEAVNPVSVCGHATLDVTQINLQNSSCLDLAFNDAEHVSDSAVVMQQVPVAAGSDDATSIYMVVAPGSYSGAITIETDAAYYTFPFDYTKGISLSRNTVKHISIDLANCTSRVEKPQFFTWDLSIDQTVSASEDALRWEYRGFSMEVNKSSASTNANNYYPGTSGQSYTSTRFYKNSSLTITPNMGHSTIAKVEFAATTTGYADALKASTWTNASAAISAKDPQLVIVTPEDGTAAISATIGGTCGFTLVTVHYTGELAEGPADPELAFENAQHEPVTAVEIALADKDNFVAPVLIQPEGLTITWSSSNPAVASFEDDVLSINAKGTTTITASSAPTDMYLAGSASYTLTVTDETPDFTTVAQLNALATSSEASFSGTLTGAVVSFVPNSGNAIIKDETGSVLLYKTNHGLLQGQTFSGKVNVTVKLYNGCAELLACDATFTGEGAVIQPLTITLASLVGHLDTYQNAYVKVEGLIVSSVDSRNISVTDGDSNTYIVFAKTADACLAGDIINVVGTIAHFGSDDQITAWTTDAITVTGHLAASHTVTLTQPTGNAADAGCSIAATVSGNPFTSGETLEEGTVVTLTATEGEGFSFSSWSIEGASPSDANAKQTTFTVGTSDVSISANFSSVTGEAPDPETIDFSTLSLDNGKEYKDPFDGGNFAVTFSSGSKYYNTGTAMRVYGEGSFTVSSAYTMAKIELTFGSGDGSNAITTNPATYENGTWTGSSNSVVFSVGGSTGHRRIKAIKVTYEGNTPPAPTYSVTWANPTQAGCSISATVEGNAISSGDEFEESTVVSITATEGTGFTFSGWTISGASVTNSTSKSTEFTVGTTAVNFSASFTQSSGGNGTATFSPDDFSGQGTSGTGSAISATVSGITFACDKGFGTEQIRCYSGAKITISAESGKTIKSISFTFSGSYTGGMETSYSDLSTSTWEKTLTSQARLSAITVTYN